MTRFRLGVETTRTEAETEAWRVQQGKKRQRQKRRLSLKKVSLKDWKTVANNIEKLMVATEAE